MPNEPSNPPQMHPTAGGGRAELVVLLKPEAGLRATAAGPTSVTGANTASLAAVLSAHRAVMHPLFGLSEDRLQAQTRALLTGVPTPAAEAEPDLARFYRVAADESRLAQLAQELRGHQLVEAAYVKPAGEPPVVAEVRPSGLNDMQPDAAEPPSATPNFVPNQVYLNAAPVGVDAQFAWSLPGGSGSGIKIIDCEWGWRFTHEDLLQNQGGVVAGTSSTDTNHGTAVLGVISGDANAFGITGIAYGAVISASSFNDQSTSQAIKAAADKLGRGDIILLEIHRPGPNAPSPPQGQLGYIAIEWWPDDFAAIRYAVQRGLVVVEAAGNGSQNLD